VRTAILLLAACGAQPKAPARPAPAPAPAPPPLPPKPAEKLFPAEVVQWDHGRETVLARTATLDPTTWPKTTAGIWFVRPATEDLDTHDLKQFVARATALGAPGISLAGERNADDDTLQPAIAPTLTFIDLSSTHISDRTVVALAALPQLRHLWLSSTPITDAWSSMGRNPSWSCGSPSIRRASTFGSVTTRSAGSSSCPGTTCRPRPPATAST